MRRILKILEILEELQAEQICEEYPPYIPMSYAPIAHTTFKPPSTFYPSHAKGYFIDAFYHVTFAELRQLCDSTKPNRFKHHNLNPRERLALKALASNHDLIVKQTNKGGGVVIQNRSDYIKKVERLLSDTKTYIRLPKDPLDTFKSELKSLVDQAYEDKVINSGEYQFLYQELYKHPYLYHLPKVHKVPICPVGRPVIAAMDSITSGLSQYVDCFLQPIVQSLPSYVRDSSHLLDSLSHYTWESSYTWLSLDVTSLYTSIPHEVGLTALGHFLAQDPNLHHLQAQFILDCTQLCLEHNYFKHLGGYYLQVHGTVMFASFAPCYANLIMGWWESCILRSNPLCISDCLLWKIYR